MSYGMESLAVGTLLAEFAIAIALMPELIKHRAERRERNARIGLNIETVDPRKVMQPIYGMDQFAAEIDDLIDRASKPDAYNKLNVGNEILIVGPVQAGKKALALHIAKLADIDQVIIVYNPRDADVLARAKTMVEQRQNHGKTMLLLPNLDAANSGVGEAWHDQLEALIETASNMPNILVIGTTKKYDRSGEVASWFGTVLPMPKEKSAEWDAMIHQIAEGFLDASAQSGYSLSGIERGDYIARILAVAPTPAEVKDIFAQCETLATFRQRTKQSTVLQFTPDILDLAMERVIPETLRTLIRASDSKA